MKQNYQMIFATTQAQQTLYTDSIVYMTKMLLIVFLYVCERTKSDKHEKHSIREIRTESKLLLLYLFVAADASAIFLLYAYMKQRRNEKSNVFFLFSYTRVCIVYYARAVAKII